MSGSEQQKNAAALLLSLFATHRSNSKNNCICRFSYDKQFKQAINGVLNAPY